MLDGARGASEVADISWESDSGVAGERTLGGGVGQTPGISDPALARKLRLERLCRELVHLVRPVAVRFARRLPAHVELEDLMAAGREGLVLALRQHGDKPIDELQKLARQRIRGAILDYLRGADYLSRRQRVAVGALQRAKTALERDGVAANLDEVAASLGVSAARAQALQDGLAAVRLVPLPSRDSLADAGLDPLSASVARQEQEQLARALARLPERLQALLSLYYYEELSYQEISDILTISRSRICQLHTQAIEILKRELISRAA